MITVSQAQTLLTNQSFLQRVQYAMVEYAQTVMGESPNVPQHAQRAAKASAVLGTPAFFINAYAQGVVSQLNLASTNLVAGGDCDTTEAQILTLIGQLWNEYLGGS
jgi:hypothetical protein